MRYRKLAGGDDYSFGNGQQDFYRDVPEAVGQACKTRLMLWLGEWFLDVDDGTLWVQGVLGKHSEAQANTTIQDRAAGTQGLTQISNYTSEIEPNARAFQAQFDIDTIYGPTEVQVENYANY